MTVTHQLRGFLSKAARGVRRLTGLRTDLDYRRRYAACDLQRDYWTIVGPTTKEEYERLSAAKLQLLRDLGLTSDSRVLDVGCGTGMLTAALHDFLCERGVYLGVDISPQAIAFCRSRFSRPNFTFRESEMTALPHTGTSFDFIVFFSIFTHTYPEETVALLREASRLLAANGLIFADVFTAPLVDLYHGDRALIELNQDYFLRLVENCDLHAELVQAQPSRQFGQRMFFKFQHATCR
jgi:SAM-dependent methyltransferase